MLFRLILFGWLAIFPVISFASAQSPDPIIPTSGIWEVALSDLQNNCPSELRLADALAPKHGSQYSLTFSTLDAVPLDLHQLVAPLDVAESPEFFSITTGEFNQYEIIPAIQTQPLTYRYAVLDEQYIVLEYTQTLALSDCVLTATYGVNWVSADSSLQPPDTVWLEPIAPQTDTELLEDILFNGIYDLVIANINGSCLDPEQIGVTYQLAFEFSTMRQGGILVMLAANSAVAIPLYRVDDSTVYSGEYQEIMNEITVLDSTHFTMRQGDTSCEVIFDAVLTTP